MTPKSLWSPVAPEHTDDPFTDIEPKPSDWYLVVDEIDENRVRLDATRWPLVDDQGWLEFPSEDEEEGEDIPDPARSDVVLDAASLHAQLTEERTRHQQPAAARALRVGDTFWFRGAIHRDADEPVLRGDLVDITYAARAEAKAAQHLSIGGEPPAQDLAGTLLARVRRRDDTEDTVVDAFAPDEAFTGPHEEATQPPPERPATPGSVASPAV